MPEVIHFLVTVLGIGSDRNILHNQVSVTSQVVTVSLCPISMLFFHGCISCLLNIVPFQLHPLANHTIMSTLPRSLANLSQSISPEIYSYFCTLYFLQFYNEGNKRDDAHGDL